MVADVLHVELHGRGDLHPRQTETIAGKRVAKQRLVPPVDLASRLVPAHKILAVVAHRTSDERPAQRAFAEGIAGGAVKLVRARSEGGILPVHLVIQLAVEFAHRGFKRGEFRRIILQQRAPLRHPGTEKVEDLGKEILPAALRVRVAGAEGETLRGVGHHLDFEALGENVDGR